MMSNALSTSPDQNSEEVDSLIRLAGQRYCTEQQPVSQRLEWLKEIIGREYANVDITPPQDSVLFNDMQIYPWQEDVRLSPIQSNAITLERLPQEPTRSSQDCYFMVVLTSGKYKLEQGGREVFLKPGDMTIYDATEPHRISIPEAFSKILISIPRPMLDQRLNNIGRMTATLIPSADGIGLLTTDFIQSTVNQLEKISKTQFLSLSHSVIDMLTLSLGQVTKNKVATTHHRQVMLIRVKQFIKSVINDPELTASKIADATGLSKRYINNLFSEENTSLMQYLTAQRLESCRYSLVSPLYTHLSVTQIAMRFGFNNMSHFSRIYKKHYGESPSTYRKRFNDSSNDW